jgi:hypothetical protein
MLNLKGSFLVIRAGAAPVCEVLSPCALDALDQALSMTHKRAEGYRERVLSSAFGGDVVGIVPTTHDAMAFLVREYSGPQQAEIQAIAARLLLREPPHPTDQEPRQDDNGGGSHDRVPTRPKTPRGPAGVRAPVFAVNGGAS